METEDKIVTVNANASVLELVGSIMDSGVDNLEVAKMFINYNEDLDDIIRISKWVNAELLKDIDCFEGVARKGLEPLLKVKYP